MNAAAIALNRFGLGARPGDPVPHDSRAWLTAQFADFEPKPRPLAGLPDRREIGRELVELSAAVRREADAARDMTSAADGGAPPQSARRDRRRTVRDHYVEMNAARVESALTASAPFVERLVHFWANHFAVSADKLSVVGLAGLLEFEAIRPHVLGRFADLLLAVERHPAMLLYLDQARSVGPNSRTGTRSGRRGLNENLAREILELHTLGVDGGYTQADVTEFARALTGWTVGGFASRPVQRLIGDRVQPGEFVFLDSLHEPGERTILGRRYPAGGEGQARAVLADLALHHAAAHHISTKLARHFAGDEPSPAMITRLERAFIDSQGDLPTVYRALIASPEAWAPEPVKFKTPWEWVVSALRALSAETLPPPAAAASLVQLGQPTWRPGSPAGWDDLMASWAGPEALVRRAETAERIVARTGGSLDARRLAEQVLPGTLSDGTRASIEGAEGTQQGLALLLLSPEFLRR